MVRISHINEFLVAISFALITTSLSVAQTTGDCIAIEFSSADCTQCAEMHKATDKAIEDGWVIRRFDTKQEPHIALRWQIKSVPTTVLIRNGREYDRILGPVEYRELTRRMEAVSSVDSLRSVSDRLQKRNESTPFVRAQSPSPRGPAPPSPLVAPQAAQPGRPSPAGQVPSLAASSAAFPQTSQPTRAPISNSPVSNRGSNRESTVRIRIIEAQQDSVGTGTIIDLVNGEALVLTCGHLFRDAKPDAKITVETFIGGQTQMHPATLVDFEAKEMDIGLVAFRPSTTVPVARLIPRNRKLVEGQSVTSWGCNRGADPTNMDSRITKLNRYLGPPNVEVDGLPVEGRSGGGLFDDRGELIGVCYAADPSLKEGLYNGADVVYYELGKLGLQRLFNERNDDAVPVLANQNTSAQPRFDGIPEMPTRSTNTPPASPAGEQVEMTVIIKDKYGKQERLDIQQPSPQLLQAMRDSVRR